MDDYTIHINVNVTPMDDRSDAHCKERIWRPLVSYFTWLSKGITMPGFLFDGLGLIVITNSAIIVEGIIADLVDEHCFNTGITSKWGVDLESAAWSEKKKKYNSMFERKLESYKGFDAIEVLFKFRNNVAHGLSHIEESSIQPLTNVKSEIRSINDKYQTIRDFFISRRLMMSSDTPSNTNNLWNYKNASYLWFETRCFLQDVLKHNESPFKQAIVSEWNTATSGRG